MGNLRWRIKNETSDHHIAVEKSFEALDLTARNGLATFLNAHRSALQTLARVIIQSDAEIAARVTALVYLIEDDLVDLGFFGKPINLKQPASTANASGLIYVIAGSRLGARILHKRVRSSEDPVVQHATRYLSGAIDNTLWETALGLLKEIDARPIEDQNEVIAAAITAFDCFRESIESAKARIQ